ncbi:ATP-binding protein [Thiothrix lacustris]|uniref:ATP-binding protein n=1 Tax=Thiothrix lacustris TaxID=525917 RepID=UPI00048AF01C|nr:ATP-binding protein [Thiothrix lacustris]
MKKLPIGISTLSSILNDDCVYVDKTALIHQLVNSGTYYFLSRPRRFGKSLLVDTLKELFEGNEPLFQGLAIHPLWDWTKKHPVIHITFNDGVHTDRAQLDTFIVGQLKKNAERLGIKLPEGLISQQFVQLIEDSVQAYSQPAVVLIDEYDKPILDQINNPARAAELRDSLKNLYSVLKGRDKLLNFVLLTGVSKFSQVSLFSGLNNLNDITLDARYSALCGYTQRELEHNFREHLAGADMPRVREWYNGYNWLGESVYNPFDILLFIDKGQQFRSYWFETATPSFLLKLLKSGRYYLPELERFKVHETQLGSFDVDKMTAEVLLFQTGYLTIHKTLQMGNQLGFELGYPNIEVKLSLNTHLLSELTPTSSHAAQVGFKIYQALADGELEALHHILNAFFASIPYQWYTNNALDQYEGYYASVFYSHMVACGAQTIAEDSTHFGRIDLTVIVENKVFIFEFKVLNSEQSDGSAMAQIKAKHYADKYRDGRELYLVGIEFSKQTRNIVGFEWEKI